MDWLNALVIILYLCIMLLFGVWGRKKTSDTSDYLVAGRRLNALMYTGTMSAVVLGGAASVGGVGLGYTYGLSGAWLVTAIGLGVLLLSAVFAPIIQRLKIYTVSQMLTLRYGTESTQAASIIMLAYTLMLAATSTGAYASIFVVLFGWERWLSVLVGGSVVLAYAVVGGMWSITLADMAQFLLMSLGTFGLMLPIAVHRAGGWSGIHERLDAEFFTWNGIGAQSIVTYFVVYTLGLLIGQDIWQRVFTARTPEVARWGGTASGVYCIAFGVVGAIIGMATRVVIPNIESKDDVFARVASDLLPVGLGGIALAAGVAAMMSTASGGLIAAATVARADVLPLLRKMLRQRHPHRLSAYEAASQAESAVSAAHSAEEDVHSHRWWVLGLGVVVLALSLAVPDVVAALTIAYDILVGGLFVAIIGGLVWPRATGTAALWSMIVGSVGTLATMAVLEAQAEQRFDGIYANEPIYVGLAASALVFFVVSLASRPTDPEVLRAWKERAHTSSAS